MVPGTQQYHNFEVVNPLGGQRIDLSISIHIHRNHAKGFLQTLKQDPPKSEYVPVELTGRLVESGVSLAMLPGESRNTISNFSFFLAENSFESLVLYVPASYVYVVSRMIADRSATAGGGDEITVTLYARSVTPGAAGSHKLD